MGDADDPKMMDFMIEFTARLDRKLEEKLDERDSRLNMRTAALLVGAFMACVLAFGFGVTLVLTMTARKPIHPALERVNQILYEREAQRDQ